MRRAAAAEKIDSEEIIVVLTIVENVITMLCSKTEAGEDLEACDKNERLMQERRAQQVEGKEEKKLERGEKEGYIFCSRRRRSGRSVNAMVLLDRRMVRFD